MDRYTADLATTEKKFGADPNNPKLIAARQKSEQMNYAYHDLNEELVADMGKLVEDRFSFFDPLFATVRASFPIALFLFSRPIFNFRLILILSFLLMKGY
jgi:hypothetical protein